MRLDWNHVVMGQVINFPGKPAAAKSHGLTTERRHALITGLSALTFLLGFFIAGPSLALFAFGYASTAHVGSAASCLVGLAITWAVTRYGGQYNTRMMANYDSSGLASDCWQHSQTKMPEAKWACVEWYFEGATNTQKLWLDGKAIDDLTVVGQGQGCIAHATGDKWIFPTFSRLYLGLESYQQDDPREVWIDDVALSTTKIGCPQ